MSASTSFDGVIILGTPRSGTTLLRRLVDAHPAFACPGETNVFTACGRFLRSERIGEGVQVGVLDGLGYAGFAADEVCARLRALAFAFHREYAARQGKPRWAAKTAMDAFYLEEVETLCAAHAYFVCIQRHGLDVAASIQELCEKNGGYLRDLHEYVVRYPLTLEAFAHVWVDLTDAIRGFASRHADNTLVITYEDLTAAPDETMHRVMTFVGERWDPELVARALQQRGNLGLGDWKTYARSVVDQSSVGRWRRLSRDTVARLAAICNRTLEACGYEAVAVEGGERSADETRRRYEVGLLLQGLERGPAAREAGAAPGAKGPR